MQLTESNFPTTLEDILVWKLEYTSKHNYRSQILSRALAEHDLSHIEFLGARISKWVKIVHNKYPDMVGIEKSELANENGTLYTISIAGQCVDTWNAVAVQSLYLYD